MTKFDRLDQAILKLLNRDARMPSAQMARELGISARTVQNRVQRLVDHGAVRLVGVVNPASFGYNLAVDIFCELEVGFQEQALQAIQGMPNVTYIAISTGDQDISLQAIFKDGVEMQDFITHALHQVPGMRRTRTVLIPSILKDNYQWQPPASDFGQADIDSPIT
jgi:Lrp/AsnC family transcriptional regulator for asnA, asnC and gidA